jgi:hypothetical protein
LQPLYEPLICGSFLVYPSRPKAEADRRPAAEKIRAFARVALKQDLRMLKGKGPPASEWVVSWLLDRCSAEDPAWLVSEAAILVPVPRSSVTPADPTEVAWPALRLADALIAHGHGLAVHPVLRRVVPVKTAHLSASGQRPGVTDHRHSLGVISDLSVTGAAKLCLVDDVVTTGSTVLAAAKVLRKAFPGARVTGWALLGTVSKGLEELTNPLSPKLEVVEYSHGNMARRRIAAARERATLLGSPVE